MENLGCNDAVPEVIIGMLASIPPPNVTRDGKFYEATLIRVEREG